MTHQPGVYVPLRALFLVSDAAYVSYFESNYRYHHMGHTFTIV